MVIIKNISIKHEKTQKIRSTQLQTPAKNPKKILLANPKPANPTYKQIHIQSKLLTMGQHPTNPTLDNNTPYLISEYSYS